MKYEIVETPIINYEIKDKEGNLLGDVFETKQEAESHIQSLSKNPLDEGKHYREYFLAIDHVSRKL